MLTSEEKKHMQEIVELTEEVLDAKGIECDARVSKLSEEQLREILHEGRKLRKKRKRASGDTGNDTEEEEEEKGADAQQGRRDDLEEPEYVR